MSEKELDSSINNYIEVKSNNIKQLDWDMAIGLQEVDNLKPSKYLEKLLKENVIGEKTIYEVEQEIKKYYSEADNNVLGAKAVALFKDIKKFIENPKHLCGDMSIDDLMVGHSYFMAKNEDELLDKVEYEIVPLINEYINDGILNVKSDEKKIAFDSWCSLTPIPEFADEDDEENK